MGKVLHEPFRNHLNDRFGRNIAIFRAIEKQMMFP